MDGTTPALRMPFPEPPGPGEAIEVADGVLWMRLPLPLKLDHVNVYALREAEGWIVIDTGMASRKSKAIWQALLDGPLEGRPIHRVLVTHYHPDHIGLAGWMQDSWGAELMTARTAWLLARMLVLDEHAVPSNLAMEQFTRAGMSAEDRAARAVERPFNFADVVAPLNGPFTRVSDGQSLALGGRTWRVRFGQGHAPDHITLWEQGGDLVIGGDQMLGTISPVLGVYPSEPDADPVAEFLESCAILGNLAAPSHLVLPGHKLPFTGLPDRLAALISDQEETLARLEAALEPPRTAVDCFDLLFRNRIDAGNYGLALSESLACLNFLLHRGRVTRRVRSDGAWLWQRAGKGPDE